MRASACRRLLRRNLSRPWLNASASAAHAGGDLERLPGVVCLTLERDEALLKRPERDYRVCLLGERVGGLPECAELTRKRSDSGSVHVGSLAWRGQAPQLSVLRSERHDPAPQERFAASLGARRGDPPDLPAGVRADPVGLRAQRDQRRGSGSAAAAGGEGAMFLARKASILE